MKASTQRRKVAKAQRGTWPKINYVLVNYVLVALARLERCLELNGNRDRQSIEVRAAGLQDAKRLLEGALGETSESQSAQKVRLRLQR